MTISDLSLPIRYTEEDLLRAIKRKAPKNLKITNFRILKRSIDARKKPELRYVITVSVNEKEPKPEHRDEYLYEIPRVIVVGAGPAGLFAALSLLQKHVPVLLLERGESVEERKKTVDTFFSTGILNPESNVQFGEGGAGTFSDGKLNTLTKSEKNTEILRTFVELGAQEHILYDQKPHIGTDVLYDVIRNLRQEILRLGGQIRFSACLTDIFTENGAVTGVEVNHEEVISCEKLILAIGHSSRDTYRLLQRKGVTLQQKPFAMGVRIEHPQDMITLSQYGTLDYEELGAAPYKLTYTTKNGRGVYTFCMCPGGYVVNASSERKKLCINGMSYSDRAGENANSALVVQIRTEDFPSEDPLSGIELQEQLESAAYSYADGKIPVQMLEDFISGRLTQEFGQVIPQMKGGYAFGDLNRILPKFITDALKEALPEFGKRIHGFDRKDAVLSCIEARTSSPVRILRDELFESNISGLYPAGEGAGYSGGIMSSAKDGLEIADAIAKALEAEYAGRKTEKN